MLDDDEKKRARAARFGVSDNSVKKSENSAKKSDTISKPLVSF